MKKIVKIFIIICLVIFIMTIIINIIVISKTTKYISNSTNYNDYEYVLVLGARVEDNKPSLMLKDRLDKVVEIYNKNKDIKIIVSGDSQDKVKYDEVSVMYNYLINNNVNSDNIIKDNYGISTYDSVYRMKDIVKDEKVIIVTQKYHLYRSIFIARELDIEAQGIYAIENKYFGEFAREVREVLARVKDYFLSKLNVKAKYS